jgi:hypothetical protein
MIRLALAGDDERVKAGKDRAVRSTRSKGFFRFPAVGNGIVAIFSAGLWSSPVRPR